MEKIEVNPASLRIFQDFCGKAADAERSPGALRLFAVARSTRRPPLLMYQTAEKSRSTTGVRSPAPG